MTLYSHSINNTPLSARAIYYYLNARRWLADLEFFQVEVSFLQGLLDDYFIRLTDDIEFCKKLKGLRSQLFKLAKEIGNYRLQLNDHIHLIVPEAEHSIEREEILASRQVAFEIQIPKLTHEYRNAKRELFNLVGAIVRENKFIAG